MEIWDIKQTPTTQEIQERHDFAQKEYSEVRKTQVHNDRGILLKRLEEMELSRGKWGTIAFERKEQLEAANEKWRAKEFSYGQMKSKLEAAEKLNETCIKKRGEQARKLKDIAEWLKFYGALLREEYPVAHDELQAIKEDK